MRKDGRYVRESGELAAIALQPSFELADVSVTETDATFDFRTEIEYGETSSVRIALSRQSTGDWQIAGVASGPEYRTSISELSEPQLDN